MNAMNETTSDTLPEISRRDLMAGIGIGSPYYPSDTRPEISRRDLSYHLAEAGIAAREEAMKSGGEPAQIRALVAAANAEEPPAVRPGPRMLRGRMLRQDDLLVSLCLGLYAKAFDSDPRVRLAGADPVESLTALAELVLIFTQAETAWDLLDHATDMALEDEDRQSWGRNFRRAAVEFAGNLTTSELATFNEHLAALNRHRAPVVEDETPGKPPLPPAVPAAS